MQQMNDEMLRATWQFDEVRLTSPEGDVTARIVFKTVLAFEAGNTREGQLRALQALTDLARDVAPRLVYMQCAGPDAGPEPFDLEIFHRRSAAEIERLHSADPYLEGIDLGLFGAPFDLPAHTGVSAFGGSVTAGGGLEGTADISILEFSTSLGWDAETMFARQVQRTLTAASTLRATFGLAGFGLQHDRIYPSTAEDFAYLKRFPGIHCSLDDAFAAESSIRRKIGDRYFSVNWLTLIGDRMLSELQSPNPEELAALVGGNCDVLPYEGGLLIRAGDHPQPGDVNQGILPEDYRRVSHATQRLRFQDYKVPVINAPPPLNSLEETLAWVERFD